MATILGISNSHALCTRAQTLAAYIIMHLQVSTQRDSELWNLSQADSQDESLLFEKIMAAEIVVLSATLLNHSQTSLFNYINPKLLAGKIVLLSGTGSSYQHAQILETQLRPVLTVFGAKPVATAIFAGNSDFLEQELVNLLVKDQIGVAIVEVVHLLAGCAAASAKAA
ncbi:MAG: NAD(P)H-dependent oxidoreductase [Methylococcales bacterium]